MIYSKSLNEFTHKIRKAKTVKSKISPTQHFQTYQKGKNNDHIINRIQMIIRTSQKQS